MARKILLADDSVTAQNMGRKILADAGYEVITVNNGSAALKRINEQRPDLIVLDVYMPGYSGLEVCQRLKEAAETSRLPILLTVGKLEPFKPEEAKRVRADGFIVKPFEASELLSALSKLEDKVVPRGEPSKPGRFARATAGIEDTRFDKSMAIDEDSGWKSRISFPTKKKEKAQEAEAEDPAIYNPVNKDLRTVVDHKPAETPQSAPEAAVQKAEAPADEAHVNLGALAPEGLPKDVTPEEIAALAAAAAQVKGIAEEKKDEKKSEEKPVEMPVVAPAEEAKTEIKESAPVADPVVLAEVAPPAATFAEQEVAKKSETESEAAANPADMMAAIAGLETRAEEKAPSSGNGAWTPSAPEKSEQPVTMAVAAPAYSGPAVARWTAQAVALAPEESSISLEQEMQKAFAAAATVSSPTSSAAVAVPVVAEPVVAETAVAEPRIAESAPAEPAPSEPIASEPTHVEPAAVSTLTEPPISAAVIEAPVPAEAPVAEAVGLAAVEGSPEAASAIAEISSEATAAIDAAVKELEAVASSYETSQAPVEEKKPELVAEAAPAASNESPEISEVKAESVPAAETSAPVEEANAEIVEASTPHASEEQAKEEAKSEEIKSVETVAEAAVVAPEHEAVEQHEGNSAEPAAAVSRSFHAGGSDEMAKRESDTAAAWASWRKIQTGDPKPGESKEETKDAAMAVAVGAERSPEGSTESFDSDPEISSIVDSVLADMRPKIVEEIAKKLGKKK